MQFVVLKKITGAFLLKIAREKSCDYLLIVNMKKYEIAYHNYAEAKHTNQVQNNLFKSWKCVRQKQPRAIKTIIYNDVFTS